MNKFLVALYLLVTLACMAAAEINGSQIEDAGKDGVKALNKTLGDLNQTAAVIDHHINDFFDVSDADTTEKIWKSAVVVAFGAAGFILGVFGYKLVKPMTFISGFAVFGIFFQAVFSALIAGKAVPIIAFILGGLIGGALSVYFYRAGIFLVGVFGGVALGFELAQAAGASNTVTIILVVVAAIALGVLVLYLEKPVMIISSSFSGSAIVIRVIGFFAGNYPSGTDFDSLPESVKKAFWYYFGGLVLLTIIFAVVQYRVTAVGIDYGLGKDDKKDAEKAQKAQPKAGTQPVNMV
ncbi:hypothetical protein ACHHYP_06919 [Achlya hypogyna]|uniref:Transmembrane protein 198 n=1 Tax=Achlya hypogyna TaxID=1202772 RepID=A0A1V9ZMZ9_ACHHY|nr:hypothetical protein ACHHYP_06919 [Achlya hypogyna]